MILAVILLLLVFSIFIIWKGSDWLTDSLIPVANKLGTSYIAITTLLAALLMSMPELIISIYSYILGHPAIGIGVIIGSVMFNIGITVGLSAAIKPLFVEKNIVIRDGIFLIVAALVVMVFGANLNYDRSEGIVLILIFIPYALNVWHFEKARSHEARKDKVESIKKNLSLFGGQFPDLNIEPSLVTFFIGAALMVSGSYLFSFSLVEFSKNVMIPDILIGILLGGVGTNIPNLAAAIQGTIKGYEDAAITETFGSNIFTLLVTLGIFIVINPFTISAKVFYFDLTWMIVLHLLMILFIFKGYNYREESLTKYEGIILVLFYLFIMIVGATAF